MKLTWRRPFPSSRQQQNALRRFLHDGRLPIPESGETRTGPVHAMHAAVVASLGAVAVVGCGLYHSPLMRPDSTPSVDVPRGEATVVFVRPTPAVWIGGAEGLCTASFEHHQDRADLSVRITDERGRWLADVDPRTWVVVSVPAGWHYFGAAPLTMAGPPIPDGANDDALRADLGPGRVYFVRVRAYAQSRGGCIDPATSLPGPGAPGPVAVFFSPTVRLDVVKAGSSAWMSLGDWIDETTRRERDLRRQPPAPDSGFVGAAWSRVAALRGDEIAAHTIAPEDGVGADDAWAIFLPSDGSGRVSTPQPSSRPGP